MLPEDSWSPQPPVKKKVLVVVGTRPEVIKMAPIIDRLSECPESIDQSVCVTAQHRELLDQALDAFGITPDVDLNIMKKNQNLVDLTAELMTRFSSTLNDVQPDYVLVHGDTTTTLAASLACYYHGASVCHVEAGLRTWQKRSPFPEEINRQLTDRIADHHFAPTERARQNLLAEGIPDGGILVTGNTVIDALLDTARHLEQATTPEMAAVKCLVEPNKRVILLTAHRRENFAAFKNVCGAVRELAQRSDVQVIYPVHPNPNVRQQAFDLLGGTENVSLIEPLGYWPFVWLMSRSTVILTDSGGIQEEAPSLGKPVLVLRAQTERPEAVEAGTALLVDTDPERIVGATTDLLDNEEHYRAMAERSNPYGDGKASDRIADYLVSLPSKETS